MLAEFSDKFCCLDRLGKELCGSVDLFLDLLFIDICLPSFRFMKLQKLREALPDKMLKMNGVKELFSVLYNCNKQTWLFWTSMKAFDAFSSMVPKSMNNFFMRSRDSRLNGTKQLFSKRSTKSLKRC